MAEQLQRQVGVFGAVMMGLGSIIGTGVFVSIGIAAGVAGEGVVVAIALAAVVAACNGLSSAQLAANHPVSGGTYEYGYRWLYPPAGFTAGWMFLCAKSASAATAALGFAGYLQLTLDAGGGAMRIGLALGVVVLLTALVLMGLRRSSIVNIVIVSLTLATLVYFVALCIPESDTAALDFGAMLGIDPQSGLPLGGGMLEAAALMFVAYTGYGRVATLGEEIHHPRRNIPIAIIITLVVTMLLYITVAWSGVAAVGAAAMAEATEADSAPLAAIARDLRGPGAGAVLAVGAITAMLGVLLNLILGLSRVALAMGRRGDLPRLFGRVNTAGTTPTPAVLLVAAIIAGLACIGDVKTTWSFSAFTVLIYYALTNAAALRLTSEERLYPRAISWLGLLGCLGLAFWVRPHIWLIGLGLIGAGLVWHFIARRAARDRLD